MAQLGPWVYKVEQTYKRLLSVQKSVYCTLATVYCTPVACTPSVGGLAPIAGSGLHTGSLAMRTSGSGRS